MSTSCQPVNPLGKQWGQNESGRVNQILENARRCAVNAAIAKAQATVCCPGPVPTIRNVQLESAALDAKILSCNQITPAKATLIAQQSLRGVPESVRIRQVQQNTIDEYAPYNNPSRRFVEYQGPIIVPPCPPIPTEFSNANIPKAPTSCTALALINTGRP
jgi:hypothetical protein